MMGFNTDNQNEPPKLAASRCWFWPLTGMMFTFLTGLLWNYLFKNYRDFWVAISSILNAFFIFSGLYFIFRNCILYKSFRSLSLVLHTTAGVLLNAGLAMLLFINGLANYYFNEGSRPIPAQEASVALLYKPYQGTHPGKLDIWIDMIPVSAHETSENLENYWMLMTALRSPELNILGISTAFGKTGSNSGNAEATGSGFPGIQTIVSLPPIYLGSTGPGTPYWPVTPAAKALADSLAHRCLTIIALGPLTNIATVLKHRPELAPQIGRIILPAGSQTDDMLYTGKHWRDHLRPVNAVLDTVAANLVLYSGVPLVLLPFDLAAGLPVTAADFLLLKEGDQAARWLSHMSKPWKDYWPNNLYKEGIHPFHWLAVAYAALPDTFSCRPMSARIGFNLLLEPFGLGRNLEIADNPHGPQVIYCYAVDHNLKQLLIDRLKGIVPEVPIPVNK